MAGRAEATVEGGAGAAEREVTEGRREEVGWWGRGRGRRGAAGAGAGRVGAVTVAGMGAGWEEAAKAEGGWAAGSVVGRGRR